MSDHSNQKRSGLIEEFRDHFGGRNDPDYKESLERENSDYENVIRFIKQALVAYDKAMAITKTSKDHPVVFEEDKRAAARRLLLDVARHLQTQDEKFP